MCEVILCEWEWKNKLWWNWLMTRNSTTHKRTTGMTSLLSFASSFTLLLMRILIIHPYTLPELWCKSRRHFSFHTDWDSSILLGDRRPFWMRLLCMVAFKRQMTSSVEKYRRTNKPSTKICLLVNCKSKDELIYNHCKKTGVFPSLNFTHNYAE